MINTVTVATFNESGPAQPVKERLEQAHIPAEVRDESTMERLWFVKHPLAGIHVKVPVEEYAHARQLLQEWDTEDGILRQAVRCPECDSARVEYPQHTRKFFLPNLLGLLSGLGILEKQFYCQECQYTWPCNGHKASLVRPNQAPYYFIEGVVQDESEGGRRPDKN